MSVPRLRFKEFGGEWEEASVGSLVAALDAGVSVNSGDRIATGNEKAVLKTSCVTLGVFDESENKIVDEELEIARLKEPIQAKTIIISRMNTPALVGANAIVQKGNNNIFLPDRLWAAKIKKSASPEWTAFLLGHQRTRERLSERATGTSGSMKNLTKTDVLTLPVNLPTLPEQQKIAAFLGVVDAKIAALRARVLGLQAYKRGLMQALFSQTLRFTQADGSAFPDWEEKQFAEIATRARAIFDPTKSDDRPTLVELENIESMSGKIIGESDLVGQISLKIEFKAGDVLFGKLRPYLRKFARPNFDGVCSSEIWVMRGTKISNSFLHYLVQSSQFNQLANISSGSKMPRSDWSTIAESGFEIPHPDEQAKIAEALSAMDAKIAAVQDQVSKMQDFKKGLLQQMFV